MRQPDNASSLVVADPGLGEGVLLVAPGVVGALLLVVVLELLRRMARTLRHGDVFDPRNVRRLNGVALAMLLHATLVPALTTFTTTVLVSGTAVEPNVELTYELSVSWLLVAVLVAATSGRSRTAPVAMLSALPCRRVSLTSGPGMRGSTRRSRAGRRSCR